MVKLEIGKLYRSRSGRISRIVEYSSHRGRYVDHRGIAFFVTGRLKAMRRFPSDLIEEVDETEEVWTDRKVLYIGGRIKARQMAKINSRNMGIRTNATRSR